MLPPPSRSVYGTCSSGAGNEESRKTYIRNLIAGPVKTILTANDKPHPKPGENPIPADCYRYVIFRKLQSDLDVRYILAGNRAQVP